MIPATLLGRLAVDDAYTGRGHGEHLLMDALHTALINSRTIASYAVIVDAIDDDAVRFYRHFNFIPMPSIQSRLYLPMGTVAKLF